MLRGIQKNMIQVQLRDSRYFETALFILRSDSPHAKPNPRDHGKHNEIPRSNEMLREAHRILAQSSITAPDHKRKNGIMRSKILSFLCGLLIGASAVALLWLAVLLFA